jgi:hypothetical protein
MAISLVPARLGIFAVVSLSLASLAAGASVQPTRVISASFYDPGNPATGPFLPTTIAGVPPAQYSVPADLRVDNWNDLPAFYPVPSGTKLDLFDSMGVITPVDVDWIATDIGSLQWEGIPINGDHLLMNGHLLSTTLGAQGLITVNLHDLGSAFDLSQGYDVILYADTEGDHAAQSLQVDDGIHVGSAITMKDVLLDVPVPQFFDEAVDYNEGTTDGLGSWIRFTGLTGSSLRIEAMSVLPDEPAFLNGFQIVGYQPTAVADGDINGDGIIDGTDLLDWQRGKGKRPYHAKILAAWEAEWGVSARPIPLQAVPEPRSVMLLGISALCLSLAWRSRAAELVDSTVQRRRACVAPTNAPTFASVARQRLQDVLAAKQNEARSAPRPLCRWKQFPAR